MRADRSMRSYDEKSDGGSGLWHVQGSGIACGGKRVSEGDHHIGGHGAVRRLHERRMERAL